MKSVLPIAPSPAPSAPADSRSSRESEVEIESFASVLDRRFAADQPRPEESEVSDTDAYAAVVEGGEGPALADESETENDAQILPLTQLPLMLPLLPLQPVEVPQFLRRPVSGEASPVEGDEDSAVESVAAELQAPVQSAASIFAAPRQSAAISAAPTAAADALEPVSTRDSGPKDVASDSARLPVAEVPVALTAEASVRLAETAQASPETATELDGEVSTTRESSVPEAAPKAAVIGAPSKETPAPVLHRAMMSGEGATPGAGQTQPSQDGPPLAPVFDESTGIVPIPQEDRTPRFDGTVAAKRGGVMPFVVTPTSPKPRGTNAAGEAPIPVEAVEISMPEQREASLLAVSRESRLTRQPHAEPLQAPAMPVEVRAEVPAESIAPRGHRFDPAPTAEFAGGDDGREPALPLSESRIDAGSPVHLPVSNSEVAPSRFSRVAAQEPISRTEIVHIAERTADTAVRMRAAGTERIEVAVQLGNGDQLTIQLQFANGEVTPHFRTSSEGLRTALEQHWLQFSERVSDRGVRLTPPVFDVNSSSSNMTDLSQQRHGRDNAYTDAQRELFSHLPRRARPQRVLTAAPLETASAAAAGVRAYA